MNLRNAVAVMLASSLAASVSGAEPSIAVPGDCAQSTRELEMNPAFGSNASVAGPASNHFAPTQGGSLSVDRVLPLDLTRTRSDSTLAEVSTGTVSAVESAVETVSDGVTGTVEGTSDALGDVAQTVENTLSDGAGAIGDVGGAIGDAGGAIGDVGAGISDIGGDVGSLSGDALGSATGELGSLTEIVTEPLAGTGLGGLQ